MEELNVYLLTFSCDVANHAKDVDHRNKYQMTHEPSKIFVTLPHLKNVNIFSICFYFIAEGRFTQNDEYFGTLGA